MFKKIGLLACLLIPMYAQSSTDATGKAIAFTCFGCHGDGGHSSGDIPSIAGKKAAYVEEVFAAFASGKEESSIMMRISRGYSKQEIKAVGEYLEALPKDKVMGAKK
jgi:cytochrome subunit of sulfide dehydrogenase